MRVQRNSAASSDAAASGGDGAEPPLELVAPAGKPEVLAAAIEAGADAVYLAGKRFNMRMHRADFNFTAEQMREARALTRRAGVRLFVALNALLGDAESSTLRDEILFLRDLGPDALIVQDLGVVEAARSLAPGLRLHASTTMDVHDADTIRALSDLGVARFVTSRDLTLESVARLVAETGAEIEYFVHGDLCFAQSGQCLTSGITCGKSSNRGECMKSCRWRWRLVGREGAGDEGFLMSTRDLCLIEAIPDLAAAGVRALKIEGRMKPAESIGRIVRLYREAIDAYRACPPAARRPLGALAEIHRTRFRDLTAGYAFGPPGPGYVDPSGEREVVILSRAGRAPSHRDDDLEDALEPVERARTLALIARVGASPARAHAALDAGADGIIFGGEILDPADECWDLADLDDIVRRIRAARARLILGTPRIFGPRERTETEWLLVRAADGFDAVSGHTAGFAAWAEARYGLPAWADFSLNCINSGAARILAQLGFSAITAGLEASLEDIRAVATGPLPVHVVAHGPIPGMLLEHCLVAMTIGGLRRGDPCPGYCRAGAHALETVHGDRFPIAGDQYCRNHVFLDRELCLLPYLDRIAATGAAGVRIEAARWTAERTAATVRLWREVREDVARGGRPARREVLARAEEIGGATSPGAALRGVVHPERISILEARG